MKWRQASLAQLVDIAYVDKGCAIHHKQGALEEIKRRQRAQYHMTQAKIRRKRA